MNKRDTHWSEVSSQLLRALRGKRSQVAFSRRLGYLGRPVADWEAGRRFPTATTLFKAAALSGVNLDAAFERFHPSSASVLTTADDDGVAAWLRELRATTPIVQLAQRSEQPRFSVSRWLSGQSRPRVPQFLALVDAITGRASDLVAELVDISEVPALHQAHERRRIAKGLAFAEPWTAAIVHMIETEAYGQLACHQPGWIADILDIDRELEERCLHKLAEAGMVSIDESTGKFSTLSLAVDTHASRQEMLALKSHWAQVAMTRIAKSSPNDIFSFNIISVSDADLERVRQILRASFREIRSLVAASSPVEQVALVQLQMAAWPCSDR